MSTDLVRILGEPPAELPPTKLPTIGDALKAIFFELNDTMQTKEAIKTVANQIKAMWQKTTIPTITVQRIVVKLTELHELHKKVSYAKPSATSEEHKNSFKVKSCCLEVRKF